MTEQAAINIYHGYDEDLRMVFGFGDKDATPELVVPMYSYHTDDTKLDAIYRQNNAVDGTEWNVQFEARSLSVGDVIGFRPNPLSAPEVEIYTIVDNYGFTPISYDDFHAIPQLSREEWRERMDALRGVSR